MDTFFYLLSILGIFCSFCVIFVSNPVYSVFFLILVFCTTTSILLLLTVDFLGFIFIVVYVGAIAVLFLFVVMMLNIKLMTLTDKFVSYYNFFFFLVISFFILIYYCYFDYIYFVRFSFFFQFEDYIVNFEKNEFILGIGNVIYTHYGFIFLCSGIVLLLGMIGSICLTLYHSSFVKRQEVYKQVGRKTITSIYLSKLK